MRIAFITPEFITDCQDAGGLGNYLYRTAQLLIQQGHEVEIFVSSFLTPRHFNIERIQVHRVPPCPQQIWYRMMRRLVRMFPKGDHFLATRSLNTQAKALANALSRRHRQVPFDLVQSADYLAVGLAIRSLPGVPHVIRCSSATDLYHQADGKHSQLHKKLQKLEIQAIKNADRAYAPSNFVAAHYQKTHNLAISVIRPPLNIEVEPAMNPPCLLPERFMVHFGQLRLRKGTGWLAAALKQVFKQDLTFRMVWFGRSNPSELSDILADLNEHRDKIQILGSLQKPDVYAILKRAEAAVLPSLVDNLPNTAIESLMLGVPVIGTRGASIDELVEQDVTGELVEPGDIDELASAILKIWRGESKVRKGFKWQNKIAEEMQPKIAIQALLQLATIPSAIKKN